jgi:hypothetical protein
MFDRRNCAQKKSSPGQKSKPNDYVPRQIILLMKDFVLCKLRFASEIFLDTKATKDGFGGLVVSTLASGTQGFESAILGFFRAKNPQHAFLRKGSKAVGPMS